MFSAKYKKTDLNSTLDDNCGFTKFSFIHKNSDLSEALDDKCGLLAMYERYCRDRQGELWTLEANTWNLIRELTARREAQILDQDLPTYSESPFQSDRELVSDIFQKNPKLSENLVVKEWLESTAPSFSPCEAQQSHLQFTIDKISKQTTQYGIQTNANIVTTLDPDAPNRQRKSLMSDDASYEQSLNRTIFNYIRRGQLDDALDLCEASGQNWKAASLRGGILHSDPLFGI